MLVDLGRNDLGSVCEYGSVQVDELLQIERYSHVMHIVSNVVGRLRDDVTRSIFSRRIPGGHGHRNAEDARHAAHRCLEPVTRGFYAGSIGRWSFGGDFDSCITLRSIHVQDGRAWWQASAGIVADSDPAAEYQEVLDKTRIAREVLGVGVMARRVLFVDNFDSFSYNVVHLLASRGTAPDLMLNDDPRLTAGILERYDGIVVGPGPGRPEHAPRMLAVLRAAIERKMPLFGVCLGLQAIGQALGSTVMHAPQSNARQDVAASNTTAPAFSRGSPSPLVGDAVPFALFGAGDDPAALRVNARSEDGVVQGIAHRDRPVHGVQFHPESVLSEHGEADR